MHPLAVQSLLVVAWALARLLAESRSDKKSSWSSVVFGMRDFLSDQCGSSRSDNNCLGIPHSCPGEWGTLLIYSGAVNLILC
ncbi:hypothetical protein EV426DRAFT_585555 [Tirmania nivea]|nr:hypothetical protein EV426DRAFT_585555 [Tirmania nivea]